MVKSIYLQDGEEIFVDDEDYDRVSQHTWYKDFNKKSRRIKCRELEYITLQNFLKNGSFQKVKNNYYTKDNLSIKGNSSRWRASRSKSISKYKGVTWVQATKKWRAMIKIETENSPIHLGYYEKEEEAAKAYNRAVLEYWGGDGFVNIIGKDNRFKSNDYKTYKNQHRRRSDISKYKGVGKGNMIRFSFKQKSFYIASSDTTEQAALIYNKCVQYLYGEDVILNDVPMTDELKEFIANWEIPEKIKQLKED